MKILIDIDDSMVPKLMEMLKESTFVNEITLLSPSNIELINEVREAVNELNLIKEGKLSARNARDLIDEL